MNKVTAENVKTFYNSEIVVQHYSDATANLGIWKSEEIVFTRTFKKDDRIIELGAGTGRIAIGLAELGYHHILGVELAKEMVAEARRIGKILELPVSFRQGDATNLSFEDGLFDGAIFGFNGLMQIPDREMRRKAMREIRRVVKKGGQFVFTTHDRNLTKYKKFWRQERNRWNRGEQQTELLQFGDRWELMEHGMIYIHVPIPEEVREDLSATGWCSKWDSMRSKIADEPLSVRQFSDECRFWIAEAV